MLLSKQGHVKAFASCPVRPRTTGLRVQRVSVKSARLSVRHAKRNPIQAVVEKKEPESAAPQRTAKSTFKIAVFSSKPYMVPFFQNTITSNFENSKFISVSAIYLEVFGLFCEGNGVN